MGPQEQAQPPRELTPLGAHDLSSKRSVIPFTMEEHHAFILRRMAAHCDSAIWTEISKSACWTTMESSTRSHFRVTRTDPIGSTLAVEGTSISSRPIGAKEIIPPVYALSNRDG